jgi:hypothetical protein
MKDIKGFCKLFKLNVPVYSEFDYYIAQLSKVPKFNDILDMVKLYESAESEIVDLYKYRIEKSNEIINYLKSTRAYEELIYDNLLPDLQTTKNFHYEEGRKYISIDLKKANWLSVKKYDPDFLNELGDSYEDFLDKFDMPEVFKKSKSFRQFIFGNINPKKQIKSQRLMIQDIVGEFGNVLQIECIRHDEVIFSFDAFEDIIPIYKSYNRSNSYNVKIFTIDRVEDFKIENLYDINGELTGRSMVGCNGNLYFLNLKKYITNEEIDIRDLYFKVENRLVVWFEENLKVSL